MEIYTCRHDTQDKRIQAIKNVLECAGIQESMIEPGNSPWSFAINSPRKLLISLPDMDLYETEICMITDSEGTCPVQFKAANNSVKAFKNCINELIKYVIGRS